MSKVIAVFDFDGTLVNTPILYYAVHLDILRVLTRWRLPLTHWRLPPPRPAYEEYLRATAALEGFDHKAWCRTHGIELVDKLPENESSNWEVRFNDGTETSVRVQIAYPSCEEGITKVSEADFEKLFDEFFTRHHLPKVKMMRGARYTIEVLLKRGFVLAIISGAPLERMRQILNHLELPRRIFDCIISTDNKTEAINSVIDHVFKSSGGLHHLSFYLGDMPADVVCAQQAGVSASIAFVSEINQCVEDLVDREKPNHKIYNWRKLLEMF